MGLDALILAAIFAGLVWLSVIKRQVLAIWIAGVGVSLLAYWFLSAFLLSSYPIFALPYLVVNLYVFLFVAAMLTVAGNFGLLVRLIRNLRQNRTD